ncbi:MAG: flagellar hook-associated protein FlgK [Pseudomonadota bacterium]
MSLSSSLSNALSGLSAVSKAAEVVTSNVSNALTEGYGKRELELASTTVGRTGSGVRVVTVSRVVDQQLVADIRIADARVAQRQTQTDFFLAAENAIGTPDQIGSLSALMDGFESALITAGNSSESEPRLQAVVDAANAVVAKLDGVSRALQAQREQADQQIASDVAFINDGLQRLEEIGVEITRQISTGYDPSSLLDERQRLIGSISEIVPVKEIDRGRGQIALITPTGGILLDGTAAVLEFQPAGVITPDMERSAGSLSGLSINGRPVDLDGALNPIGGGRLDALFQVRDELAVNEQAHVDAVARDLIERFQDPAVDPSLAPGDAGLFTDAGAALSIVVPEDEIGLSQRLVLNPLVDPAAGGSLAALRDGLSATTPRDPGDATVLRAMGDALAAFRTPASGGFSGATRTAGGLSAEFLSFVATARQDSEGRLAFTSSQANELNNLLLQNGVDTDEELQNLLLIEQTYAANAQVIQTIDQLLQQLLEI